MNMISIYEKFPTEADCIDYLEKLRWPNGPICPYCKSRQSTSLPNKRRHHCNNCNTTFGVTVHTVFHQTHLPLQKWFKAINLILNAKKGVSSRQLAKDLGINKNTAWHLTMRIHKAMHESEQRELLQSIVGVGEDYRGLEV